MKRYMIYFCFCLFCCGQMQAQERIKLDLQRTIILANDSSLEHVFVRLLGIPHL